MWQPGEGWTPLTAGSGGSTGGVWRDGERVIKRLVAPVPGDPEEYTHRRHFAYWRRPAEVVASGLVTGTDGLRGPAGHVLAEDEAGITVSTDYVPEDQPTGLFAARAMARFAGTDLGSVKWLARGQLSDRLARVAHRGGWTTLERTTVADVAAHLWTRRTHFLGLLAELPQVAQHGDPTPSNLIAAQGDTVLAVDWGTLGHGPVGGDLGYWSLSSREDFDPLLAAYQAGLPAGLASAEEAALGARVTVVYTALTRADWALARVAAAPGALAGKFRHPSVAPYLRGLQRQFTQIEALLEHA